MAQHKKPVIVISCGDPHSPEIRTKLLVQYVHWQGGIPVLVDHSRLDDVPKLVEAADGIIVQGNSYAPEALRHTGQNRGFSFKLSDKEDDVVHFETIPGKSEINVIYPDGTQLGYPANLKPVPLAAVADWGGISPKYKVSEEWCLVDPNLVDLRDVDGINQILRFNPEDETVQTTDGKPFTLPAEWEYKKNEGKLSFKSGERSIDLRGMLVDPKTLAHVPIGEIDSLTPLFGNPVEFFNQSPSLSFKPDDHNRGTFEGALLNLAMEQTAETAPNKTRGTENQPVLAICGAFQELAAMFGIKFHPLITRDIELGLLSAGEGRHYNESMQAYKDIDRDVRKKIEEGMGIDRLPAFSPSTEVLVEEGSLRKIVETAIFCPMTTHRTGVSAKNIPAGIEVTAVSKDGEILEGFRVIDERNAGRFFHSIQSHPDGMQTAEDFKILGEFMDNARKRAETRTVETPKVRRKLRDNPIVKAAIDQIKHIKRGEELPPRVPVKELVASISAEDLKRGGKIHQSVGEFC